MLWTRSELKGRAKFLLKQNYWYSVLVIFGDRFNGNGVWIRFRTLSYGQ